MNLWIRSQDKETLIKCEKILAEEDKDRFAIVNYIDTKNWFRLGLYKTKERALEVLDEIQKLLMPQVKVIYNKTEEVKLQDFTSNIIGQPVIEGIQIQQASSYVYEMPKE